MFNKKTNISELINLHKKEEQVVHDSEGSDEYDRDTVANSPPDPNAIGMCIK